MRAPALTAVDGRVAASPQPGLHGSARLPRPGEADRCAIRAQDVS